MKKTIFKHIALISLIIFFILFIWVVFVFNFFSYRIKKDIYPLILDSKQILTEIVTKDFAKEKINKFLSNLQQNQKIFDFDVSNKEKNHYFLDASKPKSFINALLNFSYPIKQDGKTLGYIHVWPSPDLLFSAIAKNINITIFLLSIIFALILFIIISYLYILKYFFRPVSKISEMIDVISKQKNYDFDIPSNRSLWKEIFLGLKNLNTKVVDIKTTMKLLISVSNLLTSDMELSDAVHSVFDMLQQKVNNNAVCILFMVSDNMQLSIFAKDSFSNSKIQFISEKTNSIIWNCHSDQKEYICEDIKLLSSNDKKIFENENIKKLINIPLTINNPKGYCVGVFCVGIKDEKYFDNETLNTIREIANSFSILIFHRENYLKIKEQNRKLEMETENVTKELLSKNTMLIQKIRAVNIFCDILSYSLSNFSLEKNIQHIVEKIKQLLIVETAGVFIYNNTSDEFYTVGGSFGINNVIKTKNKVNTVLNKVYNKKQSVIVKSKEQLKEYPNSNDLEQYLNIKSVVASPILRDDKIIAILAIVNKTGIEFSEYDVKTLEQLSILVSCIIEKINLYNILKDKEAE